MRGTTDDVPRLLLRETIAQATVTHLSRNDAGNGSHAVAIELYDVNVPGCQSCDRRIGVLVGVLEQKASIDQILP